MNNFYDYFSGPISTLRKGKPGTPKHAWLDWLDWLTGSSNMPKTPGKRHFQNRLRYGRRLLATKSREPPEKRASEQPCLAAFFRFSTGGVDAEWTRGHLRKTDLSHAGYHLPRAEKAGVTRRSGIMAVALPSIEPESFNRDVHRYVTSQLVPVHRTTYRAD